MNFVRKNIYYSEVFNFLSPLSADIIIAPAQVPNRLKLLENFFIELNKSNLFINKDIVVDSPPGRIRALILSKSLELLTNELSIERLVKAFCEVQNHLGLLKSLFSITIPYSATFSLSGISAILIPSIASFKPEDISANLFGLS